MFFKGKSRRRGLMLLGLGAALLTGVAACSLRTDDPPKSNQTGRLNNQYSCLSDIGAAVDSYLKGELKSAEVSFHINCLKNALNDFEYLSLRPEQEGFRPAEIANFLNTKLIPDSRPKLSSALVREVMTLKTLIVGGSDDFISRSEYRQLVDLLDVIRDEALKNLPYVKLYRHELNLDPLDQVDPDLLQRGKAQFKQTAQLLADYLGRAGRSYHLDSFANLVREARSFLNWQNFNKNPVEVEDLRELASRFKEIAVGTDRHVVRANEWRPFLNAVAGVNGAMLDFEYQVRHANILYGAGLENFIALAEQTLSLLQGAAQSRVIEFDAIDGMLDVLERLKKLPFGIRAESVKPALKYAIQYVLRDPSSNVDGAAVPGLTLPALAEARKEFYNWAEAQRFLNRLAERELQKQGVFDAMENIPFFSSFLKGFDFQNVIPALPDGHRDPGIDFLVQHVRALFRVDDSRIWIVPDDEMEQFEIRHGLDNLGRLNVVRAVVRQLIRGFGSTESILRMGSEPWASGVTDLQMEKFYQTARRLGEDLRFMDPRKDRVGLRIFNEGNIFTFSGNGVHPLPPNASEREIEEATRSGRHLLNFTETIEVISYMWSGGLIRDRLYQRMMNLCHEESSLLPVDILGQKKIDRRCFFDRIGDPDPKDKGDQLGFPEFSNLPYMRAYLLRLSPNDREEFFGQVAEIAKIPNTKDKRTACYDTEWIELAEIATVATVLHYIETIFMLYDVNMSGTLNETEVMRAFTRFQGYIAERIREADIAHALEQGKEPRPRHFDISERKAIFAYVVRHRRIPQTKKEELRVAWEHLRWGYSDDPDRVDDRLPPIMVDRRGILEVLVNLNGYGQTDDIKACRAR